MSGSELGRCPALKLKVEEPTQTPAQLTESQSFMRETEMEQREEFHERPGEFPFCSGELDKN